MMNFLLAKNKMGFIDGTIKRLNQTVAEYMGWMRCDAMIKGWLNMAMEKDVRNMEQSKRKIWETKCP